MTAPMYPHPLLPAGFYRVIYYFDIRETFVRVCQRCEQFLSRHGAALESALQNAHLQAIFQQMGDPFKVEELARAWFEYQLVRVNYLDLSSGNNPWFQNSLFHNEVLIGCPLEEQLLYRKLNSVAVEHRNHRADCAISKRDLILTFDLRH